MIGKIERRPNIHSLCENKKVDTSRNGHYYLKSDENLSNSADEDDPEQELATDSSQTENIPNRSYSENLSNSGDEDDTEQELPTDSSQTENILNRSYSGTDKNSCFKVKWLVFICICLFVALLAFYLRKGECSFKNLKEKYPKEENKLWKYLELANENIRNNTSDKPAVFLFVQKGKGIAEKVVSDIANTSAKCCGSSSAIQDLNFNSKEAIEDYGHVVDTFKKKIKEGNVVFIGILNKIPGEAAKALHSICDTTTPLVKKVIILLLLEIEEQNFKQKLIETVEDKLKELWKNKMKPNELYPIITRVTDEVFLIRSNETNVSL